MPGSKQIEKLPQMINLTKRKRVTGDSAHLIPTGISVKQTLVLEPERCTVEVAPFQSLLSNWRQDPVIRKFEPLRRISEPSELSISDIASAVADHDSSFESFFDSEIYKTSVFDVHRRDELSPFMIVSRGKFQAYNGHWRD